MTIALAIAIGTSLAAWTLVHATHRRHGDDLNLGLMSQQWISEQRADESRHRPA